MKCVFILEGLDCANCAYKIEKLIIKIEGITNVSVNFFSSKLIIELDENRKDEIISNVEKMIKKEEPYVKIRKS